MIYQAIVFLPILGAIIAGFFGRFIGARPSELVTSGFLVITAVLSWIVFWQVGLGHETAKVTLMRWVTSGDLDVSWAIRVDTLTAVMLVVVTTVSSLVHIYSIGYMRGNDEGHQTRFYVCFALSLAATMGVAFAGNVAAPGTHFQIYHNLAQNPWGYFTVVLRSPTPETRTSRNVMRIGAKIVHQPPADTAMSHSPHHWVASPK